MLEKRIIMKCREWLKKTYGRRARAVKFHSGGLSGETGIPDLLICIDGRFVAAEAKRPGEKPTAIQYARLTEFRDAGGSAFWFDSLELFSAVISRDFPC